MDGAIFETAQGFLEHVALNIADYADWAGFYEVDTADPEGEGSVNDLGVLTLNEFKEYLLKRVPSAANGPLSEAENGESWDRAVLGVLDTDGDPDGILSRNELMTRNELVPPFGTIERAVDGLTRVVQQDSAG